MSRRVHHFQTSKYPGNVEITGYRDGAGKWNYLNPRNGQWYVGEPGPGQRSRVRGSSPSQSDLENGRDFAVRIEYRRPGLRRGAPPDEYFYTYRTPVGITGPQVEADFKARLRARYFVTYGPRR